VQAGANRSSVTTGIHSRKFQHWVENVDTAASKAGVTGTPTAVVGGKTVQWTSVGDLATKLQTAIDAG
jgi:protein-disulfide isomerase